MATSTIPISPTSTITPPAILIHPVNAEPVELDATPAPPMRDAQRTSVIEGKGTGAGMVRSREEHDSEAQAQAERKRREKLHEERRGDPAVLVDLPGTPRPEEFAAADREGRREEEEEGRGEGRGERREWEQGEGEQGEREER